MSEGAIIDEDELLLAKHTMFALATGIIPMPPYDGTQHTAQKRVQIKRRCREYARHLGWHLLLEQSIGGMEIWKAVPVDHFFINAYSGPLEGACRHILDKEIWPDGKPEE